MRAINGEELKQIQISILDEIDKFCKENKINYWLDNGTLLGAVRHKGYIPWDNDLDIGMLREDYDIFIRNFNNHNSKYKVHCYENDKNHFYAFAKVYDSDTILYEPDINGDKISVNVDVFVYDNAPANEYKLSIMYKYRDIYSLFNTMYRMHDSPRGNFIRKLNVKILRQLIHLLPRRLYIKKLVNNSKRYADKNTDYVGNFTSISKIKASKSIFYEMIDIEFEKKFYPVPKKYDEWLKLFYGDYMVLPPKEKRIPHSCEAYYLDNETE